MINVIHLVSNPVWGGGERYVLDLCSALKANGNSVGIITRGKKNVDQHFIDAGMTPGKLPLRGVWDFISPTVLARTLNRIDAPVVIHVHNFRDADIAIKARRLAKDPSKVRIVGTRHLVRPAKTDRRHIDIYNRLDAIIFVSETALNEFLESKPQIDRSKLHVIYNATADRSVEPLERPENEIRLVFAGRISPEKGVEVLLHAMPRLLDIENLRLYIAGEGRGRDVLPLMNLARRLGIADRVEWLGMLNDAAPLMSSADIGVFPSVWKESFGLVVTEFMSAGVPVVASGSGGPAEIITDGEDGLLVPPSNPAALADAIRRLATDPELRSRLGKAGRETCRRKFAFSDFYNAVIDVYKG